MSEPGGDMLRVERDGGVLRVVLNRPERRNALHPDQLDELTGLVRGLGPDEDVALLRLEGQGDAAFSSGFDIKVLATASDGTPPSERLFAATGALAACPIPSLAVIRGFCFGAGFDLAMACDFRIGTPDARFAVPAVRLGTVYEPRSVDRILGVLGPAVTKELFVVGRELDSARAAEAGVLQEVVEAREVEDAVARWTPPNVGVARAHKHIVDRLRESAERDDAFWAPLDELRAGSLAGDDRRRALRDFATRSTRSQEVTGDARS